MERRGADTVALREAPLVPVEAIRALEMYVCRKSSEYPLLAAFGWQCLVMPWASMRFDDALHTTPSSIDLRGDRLLACAWQSKVDRRRRGSRFIVPRVSLSEEDWLESGFDAWRSAVSKEYLESEHWLYNVADFKYFSSGIPTVASFVYR